MTYFNELTSPKEQLVNKIVYRPKGLILSTNEYDCFLWKESKICKGLKKLIQHFESNESDQRGLIIKPNKSTKIGFDIEFGEPMKWYFYEDKATTTAESVEEEIDFIKDLMQLNNPPSQVKKSGTKKTNQEKKDSTT